MALTYTHTGPCQTIPTTASPGLRFLASLIPAIDGNAALSPLLSPNAVFIINGNEPARAETVLAMLEMRKERLSTFRHELKAAWDIDLGGAGTGTGTGAEGKGKRVLMYESVSITAFRDDPDGKVIEVCEFSVVDLEPVGVAEGEGEGKGEVGAGVEEGLRATVLKTFMDANPIMMRMRQIEAAA
jgi:hypothetical protein